MMKKVFVACVAVAACSMIDVAAGEFSRVVCDVSALPQAQRLVAPVRALAAETNEPVQRGGLHGLAARAARPANDPFGRKWLETALDGLDTIHALQLKFAEEAEKRLASATTRARRSC